MQVAISAKFECPSCGQRYMIELPDQDEEFSCRACGATFPVAKKQLHAAPPMEHSEPTSRPSHPHSLAKGDSNLKAAREMARPTMTDHFFSFLFRLGKISASLLAVLCLLALFASIAISYWVSTTPIEAPTYSDVVYPDEWRDEEMPNPLDLRQRRLLEDKYGGHVASIVKSHGLPDSDYVELMRLLSHHQDENRPSFLEGLENVLRDRSIAAKKNSQNTPSPSEAVTRYISIYSNMMQENMFDEDKTENIRLAAIAIGFVICFIFFLMLVVSALLRIEKNTRKAR
jgi:hypothetical protein